RCRKGIARSHQIPRPFGGMTVFENLFVAAANGGGFRRDEAYDRCIDALKLCGMVRLANRRQQAFFGLGGYLAIRLSEWGIWPYPALIAAALLAGLSALPISAIVLRLRAGEFAIGMWVIAECVRLLVNLDPIIQGDTGRSLIALSTFDAAERRIFTYWLAL